MQPRYPMQPACRKHRQMLKVALAPAAVARGEIQEGWRAFLKAAAQGPHHPDSPPPPTPQGRFPEIVAENMAAEGLASAQIRQACILRKRTYANDRVMPPIVAFGAVPPGNARVDQRAV